MPRNVHNYRGWVLRFVGPMAGWSAVRKSDGRRVRDPLKTRVLRLVDEIEDEIHADTKA